MADLKIFAQTVEPQALAQIQQMADAPVSEGSKIRIMPDCHAGAGCTIGTTMTIKDRVCPNLVGVDIACGVMLARTNIDFSSRLKELDEAVHSRVPAGRNVWPFQIDVEVMQGFRLNQLRCWDALSDETCSLAYKSLGTLGGGNHFIEAYLDGYICVHTGSRNIGWHVAKYYQDLAVKRSKKRGAPDLTQIEPQQREAALQVWKAKVKAAGPDELAYLEGEDLEDYLHDCEILNNFAHNNRDTIIYNIVEAMGGEIYGFVDTVHNYIDTRTRILRKGAVSAEAGEQLVIPLNMRDGVLLCTGKGNPDWNYSAPHGAGRLYSRSEAKRRFSLTQYRQAMAGVYTTCVGLDTMDEAPFAYKDMHEIMDCIRPTVKIESRLIPIYNFKAGEQ